MSADLYPVCVEWHGPVGKDRPGHGFAQIGDVSVKLHDAPDVLEHPDEVQFKPGIHWFEVRDKWGPRRPMTPPEMQALYGWLNNLAEAVAVFLAKRTSP